jgi:hypothetical protein
MTGLAGLIDALLAARLAPRLDVLGIKGETAIGAPGPAVPVAKVENDVRLPSNAALDRQIPGALLGGAAHLGGGAPASVATRLSVAARVIGAVLADLQAEPGPVRGACRSWPRASNRPTPVHWPVRWRARCPTAVSSMNRTWRSSRPVAARSHR